MKTLEQKLAKVPAVRRKKIAALTAELVAEELSLRDVRRAHQRTQVSVAKSLGISQDQVSRLEQRTDLLISTLSKYVESMGGHLSIIAEFPDRAPVRLTGLTEVARPVDRKRRPRRSSAA